MFGHEKGAFTGALQTRKGCFELADRGTLFLDEIGEMPSRLQSKLLRVLEDGRVQRVGAEREVQVDARIVAATNADLEKKIEGGGFRSDLYFRLNVFQIPIPPLRERTEDLPALVQTFAQGFAEAEGRPPAVFTDEAMASLIAHDWPGNVRELRNVVHRALIVAEGKEVRASLLPLAMPSALAPGDGGDPHVVRIPLGTSIADAERELILRTLESHRGNKTRAAATLGISTKTLYTKLARYGEHEVGNG